MPTAPIFLTLFSAALYALSFPPLSFWPFAWIALVPFFVALAQVRPFAAGGYGMIWGVMMVCGFGWYFPEMVTNYFGSSRVVGWLLLIAAGGGLFGVYFAVFAAWFSWLAAHQVATPLWIGLGWGACEFARANCFWGNPFALLGYSQVALTPLMQIADATGPYGVGALVAAANAYLAGIFAVRLRARHPLLSLAGLVLVLGATLGYGEWRLAQNFLTGDALPVAVIQGGIARELRWNPEHREANLGHYLALTREVARARPRLIFWPENAVDFYLQEQVPESLQIFHTARDLQTNLILGGPSYGHGITGRYYHNSVFLIRRGKLAGRYDKIRLLPFAETDEWRTIFSREPLNYKPGRLPRPLRVDDIRFGVFLCFEAIYPDLVRAFALQGAEVFVNPSNDDWFGSAAPAQHQLDIATVRAIENRRYLVRPTATGFSAIIDPYGRTVVRSGFGAPEVLTASVYPSRISTPYQQWGDTAAWSAVMLVAFVSFFLLLTKNDKTDEGDKS